MQDQHSFLYMHLQNITSPRLFVSIYASIYSSTVSLLHAKETASVLIEVDRFQFVVIAVWRLILCESSGAAE